MPLRALFRRRTDEPRTIEVAFDRAIYRVRLRRHRQARRYTLRIDASVHEVVLTMPLRSSVREATNFAQKHGGWIAARLSRLPERVPFAHGAQIPLRGVEHRIAHQRGQRGTVWTATDDLGVPLLCVAGEPEHIARRITDFLKREVRRDLEAASRRYAAQLGVSIKRITVRDTASRWGSCSTTGALSYSWRLILAPSHVLDYLAAHEVAHLVEMNHSPRFWHLVEQHCPDMGRAKMWLTAHGTGLHRYGIADNAVAGPVVPLSDEADI